MASLLGAAARALRATARALAAVVALALAILSAPAGAHDIPGQMRVHVIAKPEGDRLHVLVRMPLALLLNIDLPKQGPGYLDLAHVDEALGRAIAATDKDVAWFEGERRLALAGAAARISLPSDRSFDSFDAARALLAGPKLPTTTYVFWNQGYFDAHLQYRIASTRPVLTLDFRVAPGLRDRLKLDARYLPEPGLVRAYEVDAGAGPLALDPRWYQAAASFVRAGFAHILGGPDHLLFLVCLIVPYRRIDWRLVGVVTSFTLGHSVTLVAAARGLVPAGDWFAPLVETLIAASILYLAVENVLRPEPMRRWLWSAIFGLVHGFGFSFLLREQLQFAGDHLLLSLVAFNVGIELGQLLVLALVLPLVVAATRRHALGDRALAVLVGAFAAHAAWHWLEERVGALGKADWPVLDAPPAGVLGALVASALLVAGLAWLVRQRRRSVPHRT